MAKIKCSTKFQEILLEFESCPFLEIRIKDFLKDVEPGIKTEEKIYKENPNFDAHASVSVWPNGADKETQDWVVVLPVMGIICNYFYYQVDEELLCIVSIIDIEGNLRFPLHFEGHLDTRYEEDLRSAKYLKRSTILDKADELLPKGVLTLHCDFRFVKPYYCNTHENFVVYDMAIPQRIILHCNGKEDHKVTLYDYTAQNNALTKQRFIVEGFPPVVSLLNPDSKEDRDILEHVWVFYSDSLMFLLCFDEKLDSVGSRLLKASPVFRRMVNTDLKERREKRFEIQDHIKAFMDTLFFLQTESLQPNNLFYYDTADEMKFWDRINFGKWDLRDIYKFSHFYQMEELQTKCAEELVKSHEFANEELREIAELYSDEYLSELLKSRHLEDDHLQKPRQQLEARLNFECYI